MNYLSLYYGNIDDWIVFDNNVFGVSQLTAERANKSDHLANYLDWTFMIDSGGKPSTRLNL